jgi:hypothetical protein
LLNYLALWHTVHSPKLNFRFTAFSEVRNAKQRSSNSKYTRFGGYADALAS